jgi:hypothetical protein
MTLPPEESDRIREAIAFLLLLELSECDIVAGRLYTTREAFDRAHRALAEHGKTSVP